MIIFIIEIVYGSELCYNNINIEPLISKLEYQTCKLSCKFKVNKECQFGAVQWIWLKNNKKIKIVDKKRTQLNIPMEYLIYNVTMNDAGNYSCLVQNNKLSYRRNMQLSIEAGNSELKIIRQNTVPENKSLLEDKRIYWMPKMTTEFYELYYSVQLAGTRRFQCQFFSLINYSANVSWYGSRNPVKNSDKKTFGNYLQTGSPQYEIKTKVFSCDLDKFMKTSTGICCDTELKIKSVNENLYEYYTCVIGDQLNRTYHIYIEDHDLQPSINRKSILKEDLLFTENSTICNGQKFILNCSIALSNAPLHIMRIHGHNKSILNTSFGRTELVFNIVTQSDSGIYVCRLTTDIEKSMYLTVKPCINYTALNFVVSFLGMIIISLTLFGLFIFSRRLKLAFQLKNSNRVYVMRRLVLKEVVQNPDYISMSINSKLEIPRERVNVSGMKLGEGNFGTVYLGWIDSKEVAIKIPSELGQDMLCDEVRMMHQIGRHRHILELIGVCFDEGSLWAITELASRGSLKIFLQSCNPSINNPCEEIELDQLFMYALQIGRGMEYLSSKSVIHRDLATRNILLSENGDIKIADFGLTRIVINYYHSMSEESRPFRWMAPECFLENKFTTKSDVWSYGVVLWEIFTLGIIPYFSLSFNEIRDAVCHGVINDRPEIAPDWVYDLMKKCWRFDEDLRPTFTEIITQLESAHYNEYI